MSNAQWLRPCFYFWNSVKTHRLSNNNCILGGWICDAVHFAQYNCIYYADHITALLYQTLQWIRLLYIDFHSALNSLEIRFLLFLAGVALFRYVRALIPMPPSPHGFIQLSAIQLFIFYTLSHFISHSFSEEWEQKLSSRSSRAQHTQNLDKSTKFTDAVDL